MTPSYCTYAFTGPLNFNSYISPTNTSPTKNGVYCDVGTGTASTPSTWNGTINISGGNGTANVTFIAGQVTFSATSSATSGWNLSPYQDNLLAYATNAGGNTATQAFDLAGGDFNYTGNIFVPTGTAVVAGGAANAGTFIEADLITLSGGSLTGDGPSSSGGGTTPATDSLTG
jgi:hypothetical protein